MSPIYAECGCEVPPAERCLSDVEAAEKHLSYAMLHDRVVRGASGHSLIPQRQQRWHHGDLLDNACCYWHVHGPDGRHVIGVE